MTKRFLLQATLILAMGAWRLASPARAEAMVESNCGNVVCGLDCESGELFCQQCPGYACLGYGAAGCGGAAMAIYCFTDS